MTLGQLIPQRHDLHAAADETGLRTPIIHAIREFASNAPRQLQREVGPSQVGTPCARQLAYQVSTVAPSRDVHDPWPSIVGTAVHAWLAEAMDAANPAPPAEPVWITEQRVDVGFGLKGSCDVFHAPTGIVLDWKVLGDTTYRTYTSDGPSETYRTQAHCYGLGFARAGYPVKKVGICFLGRSKKLSDLHIWSEDWDRDVALRALDRKLKVQAWLRLGNSPSSVPEKPGGHCFFCSFRGKAADGYCETTAR